MTPRFILPTDYAARDMEFSLARDGKGWRFVGQRDGYQTSALNHKLEKLCGGELFATKQDAAIMARALNLPEYSIWNSRSRRYVGKGAVIRAYARNAPEIVGSVE